MVRMRFEATIVIVTVIVLMVLVSFPETCLGKKFIVGDSAGWRFGYNYTEWAIKNGPFYLDDSLVFMYDPPPKGKPHSVYLMEDYWSYQACNMSQAETRGNVTAGVGYGFELVLCQSKPWFIVCAEHEGKHCQFGMMKFIVFPVPFKLCDKS